MDRAPVRRSALRSTETERYAAVAPAERRTLTLVAREAVRGVFTRLRNILACEAAHDAMHATLGIPGAAATTGRALDAERGTGLRATIVDQAGIRAELTTGRTAL